METQDKEALTSGSHGFTWIKNKKTIVLTTVVLLAVVLIVAWFVTTRQNTKTSTRTVEFGLRNIGELVTQEGFFTSVQTINGSREVFGITVPLTQSKYIYSYDGLVKAGVDFSKAQLEVDESEKIMTVIVQAPEVLEVIVDPESLVVYDETKNIFSPLKLNDVNETMKAMKQEVRQKALDNGILANAKDNAELLITGFLHGAFPEETYTVEFVWE